VSLCVGFTAMLKATLDFIRIRDGDTVTLAVDVAPPESDAQSNDLTVCRDVAEIRGRTEFC